MSERKYEAILILKKDIADVIQTSKEKIEDVLKQNQSSIISKEEWGEKELFNSRYSKGYFFYIIFSSLPNFIGNITKEWNVNSNIIKYILVKK